MIHIAFYTHKWEWRGTPLSHARLACALDRSRFESWLLVNAEQDNTLFPLAGAASAVRCLSYQGRSDFERALKSLNADILHITRSGKPEWPIVRRYCPLQVETNIFGGEDSTGIVDKVVCPNQYVADRRQHTDAIIAHPVPLPSGLPVLRQRFSIPADAIVCGRIGRAGCFHPWAFNALRSIQHERSNIHFIVNCLCDEAKSGLVDIENVHVIKELRDERDLSDFYSSIDIFLHYCSGGETFGNTIAEAMIHGVPVISHAIGDLGHIETLGPGGIIAENYSDYEFALRLLTDSKAHREGFGARGKARALSCFESSVVAKQWEDIYALCNPSA